jgi:hypothetical protein
MMILAIALFLASPTLAADRHEPKSDAAVVQVEAQRRSDEHKSTPKDRYERSGVEQREVMREQHNTGWTLEQIKRHPQPAAVTIRAAEHQRSVRQPSQPEPRVVHQHDRRTALVVGLPSVVLNFNW